jgi:RHS repeat-associated protein
MLWANAASGDWDTSSNWVNSANPSDHHIPASSDDAQINISDITVTHTSSTSDSAHSVTLASGTTLSLASGTITLGGGLTLSGATVDLGNAAGSTSGELEFNGTQALAGTGTVVLGKSGGNVLYAPSYGGTLTIGSGIAVRGSGGYIEGGGAVVNQGTIAADDSGGLNPPFVYDTGFSGGSTGNTAAAIATAGVTNPAPQAVYQTYRDGPSFSYTLTGLTPSAPYTLRLHFADPTSTAAGQRQFDVSVNGAPALTNFDIFAAAGQDKAVVESLPVTADSQGQLTIGFSQGSAGYPLVNGIEVDSGGSVVQAINCGELAGGTINVELGTFTDQGTLQVASGEVLSTGSLTVNGSGLLAVSPASTLKVSGNLLGNTQNAAGFNPQGTVEFDSGTGTSGPPQELEAMSADLGLVQAGFVNNFAYGTISLTTGTSVELVDLSHNTSTSSPEAVYADELIVPSGATLNLNNLDFYVQKTQITGIIVGGTLVLGGPPTFIADTPPTATTGSPYSYQFQALGTPPITYSATGVPGWAEFNSSTGVLSGTPPGPGFFQFSVTASDGIAPDATVNLTLIVFGGTGATFDIAAGANFVVPNVTYAGGSTFNVGAGATVAIGDATFTGGAIFNLGTGSVVSIGGNPTFSGTLTGSGNGTVQVRPARLYVASGGLTLNFPSSMFQWIGGEMDLGNGDLTNLGTMTITAPLYFFNDGILYNYGTIIQTGSGNLELGTDGILPSSLVNEAGAYYLLEGDGGLGEISDSGSAPGQTSLNNAGVIRKTAGTGTSSISVLGSITSTGTIEADSGTISLAAALGISQLVSNALTGGTWSAVHGAELQFPSGTAITSNEAKLTLSGAGAKIAGIAGLASNSGTFVVTNGVAFTTASGFTNSGSLTPGPGSTITVAGSFTQTSTGTLDDQIGGTPASGQFGRVNVTGTASLAGAYNLSLANGFVPASGQAFTLMSFGSATGEFTSFNGLSPFFTESLGSTALSIEDAATDAVDLAATTLTAPTKADVGQSITVSWQATDLSTHAAAGSWHDSVYLSATPTITSSSTLLGTARENITLAGGASYNASLTATLPATLGPGYHYVLLQVDSLSQQSDPNRANNIVAASTGQIDLSLPALAQGVPYADSFTAADQNHCYQVTVPAGGSLNVSLQSSASSGALALYINQGTLPTPYNYQVAAAIANQANQTAVVPQVLAPATYYILARSVSGSAATASFTVTVTQTSAARISSLAPGSGGNAGFLTIEIDGDNLAPTAAAVLTMGGITLNDAAMDFVNASQVFATFQLTGAIPGNYSLSVQQGAQTLSAPTAFQVVASEPGTLDVSLSTPQYIRSGRTGTIVITYTNPSRNDLVAPLLEISSTNSNVSFSTPNDPNYFVQNAELLAVAPSGPAGTLRPGQSGELTLTLLDGDTADGDQLPVQVGQIEAGRIIDWGSEKALLQPSSIPSAAWNTIFTNLMDIVGSSTDDYNAELAQAATYLGSLDETTAQVSDVGVLWSFLVSQADASFPVSTLGSVVDASLPTPGRLALAIDRYFNSTISGRYTEGIFGLGWTTSWQTSLSVDASGNVTVDSGGAVGYFTLQVGGAYLDTDSEYGKLTQSAGIYTFTDTSGDQFIFLSNGLLNYEQDTDGNRITLGYNSHNQPITLTYSNPSDPSEPTESLTLAYNFQGFVSQVADDTGDVWTYSYDASGHLLSMNAPGPTNARLTTSYSYDTGSNSERTNALLSITNSDGSQQNYTYDAFGRLFASSANGGAEAITYTYLGEAEVGTSDAAGNKSIVWYNDLGLPAQVQDALGHISTYFYDINGNLAGYTNAAGESYQYAYDQSGNLTQMVNPLGQTVQMTYNPLSRLTSITDAGNNTTQYSYSSTGNLLSITYPDGTQQSFTYDPLGNLSGTIEQNGNPVDYQYNAQGLVVQLNFADGTYETFGYDAHGNVLKAQTYNAGGTLSGTTTLTYNAANELTSISYPGGFSLTFSYNAQGQRARSVDQGGYTINYSYEAQGRLSELTDGSGNLIVRYTYNSLGQLREKQNGNGTFTTYTYDAGGTLTSEINYAGGSTVNSSFRYTYNLLNEMTSVTDAGGNVTTYGYDATGQLTQVRLPGGTTITYVYNAAGDRTEVIDNGITTSYSSNSNNEITQAGSTTFSYDANGNLASVTDAGGTSTYSYNDLNQLVSVAGSDGSVSRFQYSPLGYLTGETGNGAQTNFLVDPTGLVNVVASYSGSGTLIVHYNYGLGLVSQSGPSGTGYYDFNASGNTVGITGTSGAYVNQYSYLPFGETSTVTAALPNSFTFGGQFGVSQVGASLFNMRARCYMPASGQFLSNDPLNLSGGDANLRRYAMNAPTGFLDPSGLASWSYGQLEGPTYWTYNQSTGWITAQLSPDVYGPPVGFQGYSGNGVGFNNPGAQYVPDVGPIPEGYWVVGPLTTFTGASLNTHPGFPLIPLPWTKTSIPLLKRDRNSFYVHSDFGNPTDSSHGCIVFPPSQWEHIVKPGDVILVIGAEDPNTLIGPAGYGMEGFIPSSGNLPYTVDFENDGTASALDVSVTEQLDPNLDWSTLQLGSFGFGPVNVTIPAGLTQYQTTVSYQNADGSSLNVQVSFDFNVATGMLTITLVSLDPLTGLAPTGVFDGFLYPQRVSAIASDGYVQYTVQPKLGLSTGATINQQASVVFDTNSPLNTAVVTNTVDTGPLSSMVNPLPATTTATSFTVSWSGQDDPRGSGVANYSVYVSVDGGPFTAWLTNMSLASASFTGQVGHTYGFYSVAADNVGNVQPTPTGAQATTLVVASSPAVLQFASAVFTANESAGPGQIAISRSGDLSAALTVVLSSPGGRGVTAFTTTVTIGPNTTNQPVTIPIANDGRPAEGDATIPLSLSAPSSGASVGATNTASLVVHDDNPFPPPVFVQSVHWVTIQVKVGSGKRARTKSEAVLDIQFSGLVSGAGNLGAYQLSSISTRKVKRQAVTTYKPIRLTSAVPASSPLTSMVALVPSTKPNLDQTDRLQIIAADLTDVYRRPLDGNHDGQPGGSFVGTLSKNGVNFVRAAQATTRNRVTTAAMDLALEEEGLVASSLHRRRRLPFDR